MVETPQGESSLWATEYHNVRMLTKFGTQDSGLSSSALYYSPIHCVRRFLCSLIAGGERNTNLESNERDRTSRESFRTNLSIPSFRTANGCSFQQPNHTISSILSEKKKDPILYLFAPQAFLHPLANCGNLYRLISRLKYSGKLCGEPQGLPAALFLSQPLNQFYTINCQSVNNFRRPSPCHTIAWSLNSARPSTDRLGSLLLDFNLQSPTACFTMKTLV